MTDRTEQAVNSCNHSPILAVLTGPSGVGKDAILTCLAKTGVRFYRGVTATTRPPRQQEEDGRDYWFVSEEQFLDMLRRGEMLEHARVYGHHYGVPKEPVRQALARGEDVLLRTDVQGATTIKMAVPSAITIFIAPASLDELRQRLQERSTETDESLNRRLAEAEQEIAQATKFDYVVVNQQGRLKQAVEQVQTILDMVRCDRQREPVTL